LATVSMTLGDPALSAAARRKFVNIFINARNTRLARGVSPRQTVC
jgi:hypothetical protein